MSTLITNTDLLPILKTSDSFREKISKSSLKVRFSLPATQNIRSILEEYVTDKNNKRYWNLVALVKGADLSNAKVQALLSEMINCMSLIEESMHHLIEEILKINWNNKEKSVVKIYQQFLLELLPAHNYFTKIAVHHLILSFIPDSNEICWVNGMPSEDDYQKYMNVHYIINILLKFVPMSVDIILRSLETNYPYFKRTTHVQEVYLQNLLWILNYKPKFRIEILSLIFQKLLIMDLNAPREDIEESENNETEEMEIDGVLDMNHPVANSLDICLQQIFLYINRECYELDTSQLHWERTKELYFDLLKIFENFILPTFESHHIQFLIFYLCSLKVALSKAFLNWLWKKIVTVSVAPVYRQAAIAYLSGVLARASYISLNMLKNSLEQMANWIHSYINSQDNVTNNRDPRVHTVFYGMCQALFYVIAFRHCDLMESKKNLIFLQSLNLFKIVACRLNPLRFCIKPVVQKFASITRTYQLVYCYTIIDQNERNTHPIVYRNSYGHLFKINVTLQTFFPFEPYLLHRSKSNISPLFIEYKELVSNADPLIDTVLPDNEIKSTENDEDDFLVEHINNAGNTSDKKSIHFLGYSTSLGYKTQFSDRSRSGKC